MRRTICVLALAGATGCSQLGPPVQGARTGDKIIRATEPTTFAQVAEIAWGDSSLAPAVAALSGMSREQDVPRGTVLVLPTRERLEARLTEARLFSPAPEDEGAAPPDGAARPAVSLKRRREAAAAYERGLAALAEHRPDDALREWEAAWAGDPGYPGLAERLTTEYRVRGLEAFSRGELGVAVGLWERALEVDPTDGTTLGYLQRAREQQVRSEQILKSGDAR